MPSAPPFCDVDQSMLDRESKKVHDATGQWPKLAKDFRHVLDDPSIDAVVIATPHHWHVPMAVRALRAGKDVYLEKPGSHRFREGRVLVDTVEETGRIVQHGTQMRSSRVTAKARELLDSGVIGEGQDVQGVESAAAQPPEAGAGRPGPAGRRLRHVVGAGSQAALQFRTAFTATGTGTATTGTATSGETAFTTWTWPISGSLPRPIPSGSRRTGAGFTWMAWTGSFPTT